MTCTSIGCCRKKRPQSSKAFAVWATSEYEHNGLRADGEKILGRLFGLVRGEI